MSESIAWRERQGLTTLFAQLGPDQPTLCEGWKTADLAAHLVIREHRPDAAAGILFAPLASWNNRVIAKFAPRFAQNISILKRGAPIWSPIRWFDAQVNTLEMLIHHEDVRRGQPEWEPRDLAAIDAQLWSLVKRSSAFSSRKSPTSVTLATPDGRTIPSTGSSTVVGEPMELLLYVMGRTGAARVEIKNQSESA